MSVVGKAFNSIDPLSVCLNGQDQTASYNLAIETYCTGTAYTMFAPDMCAGKSEIKSEKVGQIPPYGHPFGY
jgi:hypothetical protein